MPFASISRCAIILLVISGIDGTKAIHYHIFNLPAINRLDRYGRTERVEYSIIDDLYVLEATRRSRSELDTACA